MSAKILRITKLVRTHAGKDDELILKEGVNLIVGEKDTGKTAWLRMLDYLMGDNSLPQEACGEHIATKYDSIGAILEIGDEKLLTERRWKESGAKAKVFVDGEGIHVDEFSQFLLKKLNIPQTHFPKGSPFAERAWPSLSWRMLFRHIYRQERFWSDFADKQPPVEQAACLLQFLGVADAVYPPKYGELVQKQRELEKLQGEKEAYSTLLHSIATELLQQKEMSVAITEEAVKAAEQRLQGEADQVGAKREELLVTIEKRTRAESDVRYEQFKADLLRLDEEREQLDKIHEKHRRRIVELELYLHTLATELEKLERATIAGTLFADLKVTQCPVCDQEVHMITTTDNTCYLCGRSYPGSSNTVSNRLSFEEDQLKEEKEELNELLGKLRAEEGEQISRLQTIKNEILRLNESLTPARQFFVKMIPPDLSIMDQELGRIHEKLGQLLRIRKALTTQKDLAKRIKEIEESETQLKKELVQSTPNVNLGDFADIIQDRMNQYLNIINMEESGRWQHGPITFTLREKEFTVMVKKGRWNTQIGATSQALVLFAYHYALLSLVGDKIYNYPGLVIIDFPMQLADGTSVVEAENYLVKPFIELCSSEGMEKTQFIAAGRAFENLPGSHQIHLQTIW